MNDKINVIIGDKKRHILECNFKKIFSNACMFGILKKKITCMELWYHCMNQIILMEGSHFLERTSTNPRFKYSVYNILAFFHVIKPSFKSWFHILHKRDVTPPIKVLFISRDRFIKIRKPTGEITSDYLFNSIIEDLSEKHPNINIGLICTAPPPKNINIAAYNLYAYIQPFDFVKSFIFALKISVLWAKCQKQLLEKHNFKHNSQNLLYLRTNRFFSFRMLFIRSLVDHTYYRMFNLFTPDIIISNDDSMQIKPKLRKKFYFITLQSAQMSPINELYTKLFLSEFGDDSCKSDYFLCSGKYFEQLKKFSNISKNVMVIGQPRYDILCQLETRYSKKRIIEDLGLDPHKKIVLWTTQTHGLSYIENIKNIEAVYNAMSSLKGEAQLIIKLHPSEDQDAVLYSKKRYNPLILSKNVDTYRLIFCCDVLITKYSTTALEAIMLGKPVIVLNLSGEPDRENYVRENVALGVYTPETLINTIKKIFKDDDTVAQLKKCHKEYIEKYLYKNDGKSTERMLKLIESLL